MSVSRGTVHSIQFLRFVAATVVVVFHTHLGIATRLPGGTSPSEMYLFGFGAVGVHIFFVISGYIMYLTNMTRPQPFAAGRFFARRMIRIYPAYWMFVALYVAVETALAIAPPWTAGQLGGALLLWPADAAQVIGPAWTLSYELFFYFAFGLAMLLGARRGVWTLTASFFAAVAIGAALRPALPAAAMATNALLLEFVAGVWIARITNAVALSRAVGWLALGAGAAGFVIGFAWGYDRLPSAMIWGGPSILLVAGTVILEQTAADGWRAGLIRRLSVLGDSSYSLYLCHILLVAVAIEAITATGILPPRSLTVTAVTLTCIGAAHAFYLAVEGPVVRRLHRLTERRAVTPPRRPDEAASAR